MQDLSCKGEHCSERQYIKRQYAISECIRKLPSKQYTQHDFECAKQNVVFSDYQNVKWMYNTFNTIRNDIIEEEEPSYDNSKWNRCENIVKGHECRGIIFKGEYCVNYGIAFMKMKCDIHLAKESEFWIFLRGNGELGGSTAVIRISKDDLEDDNQFTLSRITVALGSYFNIKGSDKCELKFLRKEQVVPEIPKSIRDGKQKFEIREVDLLSIEVIDDGKECIKVMVEANKSGFINEIKGNFFIPTNSECNVLFAGSGHKCAIEYLAYETDLHRNLPKGFNGEKNEGDGCEIF